MIDRYRSLNNGKSRSAIINFISLFTCDRNNQGQSRSKFDRLPLLSWNVPKSLLQIRL